MSTPQQGYQRTPLGPGITAFLYLWLANACFIIGVAFTSTTFVTFGCLSLVVSGIYYIKRSHV